MACEQEARLDAVRPLRQSLRILATIGTILLSACGEKPGTYPAEYHLLDHLDSAVVVRGAHAPSAASFEIAQDRRQVLFQHPPSRARFPGVPAGRGARLLVAPAIQPEAWRLATDGVRFEARCRRARGGWLPLVDLYLSPRRDPADPGWHDREVALASCSRPTTDIELGTSCGPRGDCLADWAAWGSPRVIHPRELRPRASRVALLISIDTLRPDRLEVYGAKRATSPELRGLAAQAVVFETVLASSPWTIPSHASLLTSTDPRVHGADTETPIAETVVSVAEVLARAGWRTAAFVDTSFLDSSRGFDRGFGHYDDGTPAAGAVRRGAFLVRQRLLDWLAAGEEGPAFVFWHIMDAHGPYGAPAPFGGRFRRAVAAAPGAPADPRLDRLRLMAYHDYLQLERFSSLAEVVAAYDEGILAVDAAIGGLLRILRRAGLYDEALIVVTSDHGESLADHGVWVGHGLFLTDDELRVPLLVKLPGNRYGGTRVAEISRLLDVAPTMLEALGLAQESSFQGRSLLPPRPGIPAPPVFGFSNESGAACVRTEDFKYIGPAARGQESILRDVLRPRAEMAFPPDIVAGEQLYDLRRDPRELSPLAVREEDLEPFRELLARHAAECAARRRGVSRAAVPELTPDARRRLEALGYFGR